jgi:glycosyltransferase involved in cell wall biosynthesis
LLELDYPDSDGRGIRFDTVLRQLGSLKNARQVVTISEHSKQRIVAHLRIDPERISVVPLGVDTNRFRGVTRSERDAIRDQLKLPREGFLVLYVGSEVRRKNLVSLVRGLGLLAPSMPELMFLKIGASQSRSGREVFQSVVRSSGLTRHSRTVECVAERELPARRLPRVLGCLALKPCPAAFQW